MRLMLLLTTLVTLTACGQSSSNRYPATPTAIPRSRPINNDYQLGKWHEEIAKDIAYTIKDRLKSQGVTNFPVEIEITPAKTFNDELIIFKHLEYSREIFDMPFGFGQIRKAILDRSRHYGLQVDTVVDIVYYKVPFGEFDPVENRKLHGWCQVPYQSIETWMQSTGPDLEKKFIAT